MRMRTGRSMRLLISRSKKTMNDQIHACLDGEHPRSVLSLTEVDELVRLEEAADTAVGYIRTAPIPDFTARVMACLPEPQRAPSRSEQLTAQLRAAFQWFWTPRELVLRPRPAYAFGAAFTLLVLALGGPIRMILPASPEGALAASGSVPMYVQFRLDAPGASQVSLAGSFTGWQPRYELREVAPGVWTAMVPLKPGVHDYLFMVDGEQWIPDPVARPVEDGFGGTNSRLFLARPVSHSS